MNIHVSAQTERRPAWGRPFKNLKFEIRSEFALKSPFSLWFYTLETLSRTWSSRICKKRFQNFGKVTFCISPTSDFWFFNIPGRPQAGLKQAKGRPRGRPGAGPRPAWAEMEKIEIFSFLIKIFFSKCLNVKQTSLIHFWHIFTHTLFKVHYLKSFSLCYSAWNMWETQIKKRL